MDHSEAVTTNAVEQYFLGELRGAQRDAFEEHFMTCAECAQEVRIAAMFMDNTREVLQTDAPSMQTGPVIAASKSGWFVNFFRPAVAVPVFAVLLVMIAYQSFVVIPRMRLALSDANAPRTLATFSLLSDNSRGGASSRISVAKGQPFALFVDIPPQPAYAVYTLDVEPEGGAPVFSLPITAEEAQKAVELLVPGSRLGPGQYELIVSGENGTQGAGNSRTEISHSKFTLETH